MIKAHIKDGKLIMEIPLIDPPRPSGSGKTLLVATTSGNITLEGVTVGGKVVKVGLNAYVSKD